MSDKQTKTTTGKMLVGTNENMINTKTVPLQLPKSGEAQILTKLANNLHASYQLVKLRQQRYNELCAKSSAKPANANATNSNITNNEATSPSSSCDVATKLDSDEWQQVCYGKNKLKRKKLLSTSLTSVTDSVNQEKRTRIEGMQLHCRGKLPLQMLPSNNCNINNNNSSRRKVDAEPGTKLSAKPPLPHSAEANRSQALVRTPPPRLKRKLEENVQTIQKLNALAEQLRAEMNELKCSLSTERGAVRVLRAQNEAETRKWKNEIKRLQNALELSKKSQTSGQTMANQTKKLTAAEITAAADSLLQHENQRLTNEIALLKEASKALEETKVINCDADRRKMADMRALRDSHELRLTQITKSAKIEISRLLEEIKAKDRNIGQLKKDLQIQQVHKQQQASQNCEKKRRNATTIKTNLETINSKPKKLKTQKSNLSNEDKAKKGSKNIKHADCQDTAVEREAQSSTELKRLKDFELINNTKNHQNNNVTNCQQKLSNSQQNIYQPVLGGTLENKHTKTVLKHENFSTLIKIPTLCAASQQKEYHSMPHELTEHALERQNNGAAKGAHDYRGKDNNSDSDSALSSAPPSISPQPPPAGLDTADIWQTIRTYTADIEKLQKDIELLQKENENLNAELIMAKEEILETEKTAKEATNNTKCKQLTQRIKFLEQQEHQLLEETTELREQNELLEFRILELEDTSDKWSLQSNGNATEMSQSRTTSNTNNATNNDVWSCAGKPNKDDPMQQLFGSTNSNQTNAYKTQHQQHPHHHQHHHHHHHHQRHQDTLEAELLDISNDELVRRITNMLQRYTLAEEDQHCLQQLLSLVQQLDMLTQRSGPASLNTTSSSDEASSLDLVKSRISDYSSASSTSSSSARSLHDNNFATTSVTKSPKSSVHQTANSRIVATVQPYNSVPQHVPPPTNSPNESPRKTVWQHSSSLSESGVFVESDFLSDASEQHVCTQTEDFDDDETVAAAASELCSDLQRLQQRNDSVFVGKVRATVAASHTPILCAEKRLQYYKQRLELLESKVLIYESSGDLQAKRLADRLQREIQLEKELRELYDRVESLECDNATLEEEKCEFEEAENDTRLRLQRLEIELEILSQRNVELEMSREALSAKYKDCRSECLILRDDLATGETQIRHLEEDKQKAKENLEFLHSTLPLFLLYSSILSHAQHARRASTVASRALAPVDFVADNKMGNETSAEDSCRCEHTAPVATRCERQVTMAPCPSNTESSSSQHSCQLLELHYLKEEVKCLRHQIKELNARHYEAMEAADSHWVDLEREYKDREEAFRTKEMCLKSKINKLQDCLRDDARAANEKIQMMEDAEKELKCCLVRVSKEHRDIMEEYKLQQTETDAIKEQCEQLKAQQKPLCDALDQERKRNKSLSDNLSFMRKLQQETEIRSMAEMETTRLQIFDLKKEFLHIEVTNSELKEEVNTLELQVQSLECREKEYVDKIRCLTDEVRSKEDICQKLEQQLTCSEGNSLAHELNGSPSKRFKREDIHDLRSASKGLSAALKNMKECESQLPTTQQFQNVARDVKKLADSLLHGNGNGTPPSEEAEDSVKHETPSKNTQKFKITEITRI